MDERHLESIPLFASLSKRERRQIARSADEVEVDEGKHLIEEGNFAWEFFIIEEGTAQVIHAGRRVAELGPGDFMGEIAAMDRSRRRASVVATSPMKLAVMTARDFHLMTESLPVVGARIRAAIEERTAALAG